MFKGKWAFEVELLTDGPVIIGWSEFNSPFNESNGVGSGKESFGICGCSHELIKLSENIGFVEKWSAGDIIGCTIDLDDELIAEFYLNGNKIDFSSQVFTGPNRCYYPAITLLQNTKI